MIAYSIGLIDLVENKFFKQALQALHSAKQGEHIKVKKMKIVFNELYEFLIYPHNNQFKNFLNVS